jgi:flagellar hook-associated protein 2
MSPIFATQQRTWSSAPDGIVWCGYRLQLAAKEGGADSAIEPDAIQSGTAGGFTTLTDGADKQITFAGINPYSITSKSNTFVGLMPGVDVAVSEVAVTPVTITVDHDYEQIADSVSALVDQFNELNTKMAAATRVDPGLTQQVPLAFNSNVHRAEQTMLRAIVDPVGASSFGAPSVAGIELQRDGTITFDRDKFMEAAKTDIGELTNLFSTGIEGEGLLDRLVLAADEASAFGTGLLSSAQESEKSRIEPFTEQIDAYEARLERKEEQLRKIYSTTRHNR